MKKINIKLNYHSYSIFLKYNIFDEIIYYHLKNLRIVKQ